MANNKLINIYYNYLGVALISKHAVLPHLKTGKVYFLFEIGVKFTHFIK